MRIQFEILLFLACVNLSIGLIVMVVNSYAEYAEPITPYSDVTEFESQFNATEMAGDWQHNVIGDVFGDLIGGFDFFFRNFRFLVDGLPYLLDTIKYAVATDASTALAFDAVANILRAIYAILVATFVIEFISNRQILE